LVESYSFGRKWQTFQDRKELPQRQKKTAKEKAFRKKKNDSQINLKWLPTYLLCTYKKIHFGVFSLIFRK
jgi:hypothetical protein